MDLFEDFLALIDKLSAFLLARRVVVHPLCLNFEKVIQSGASHACRVLEVASSLQLPFRLKEPIPDLVIALKSKVRAVLALKPVATIHPGWDLEVVLRGHYVPLALNRLSRVGYPHLEAVNRVELVAPACRADTADVLAVLASHGADTKLIYLTRCAPAGGCLDIGRPGTT